MGLCLGRNSAREENDEVELTSLETSPKEKTKFKVILLGETKVGKTQLQNAIVKYGNSEGKEFSAEHKPTIGADFELLDVVHESGKKITVELWDSAGDESYRALENSFYKGSDLAGLCYAVDNRESFTKLKTWREEFVTDSKLAQKDDGSDLYSSVVIATKCDLPQEEHVVDEEEARLFAEEIGAIFIPTSAKEDIHIKDVREFFAFQEDGKQADFTKSAIKD